jgi:hypothetical protein
MWRSGGLCSTLWPATIVLALAGGSVRAESDPAVRRGLHYFRGRASTMQVGESALIAMALLKAEVPLTDAALNACLSKVRARFTSSGFSPERSGGRTFTRRRSSRWPWPTSTPRRGGPIWRRSRGSWSAGKTPMARGTTATARPAMRRSRSMRSSGSGVEGRQRRRARPAGDLGPRRPIVPVGPDRGRELDLPLR